MIAAYTQGKKKQENPQKKHLGDFGDFGQHRSAKVGIRHPRDHQQ